MRRDVDKIRIVTMAIAIGWGILAILGIIDLSHDMSEIR